MISTMRRYVWVKDDPVGMEHAELVIDPAGLTARSVAIGSSPVPYRLDLELDVGDGWVTQRLALNASGDGWSRSLVLDRDRDGSWRGTSTDSGAPPPAVEAARPADVVAPDEIPGTVLDVDVQWSPLTNLMPIRRLGLASAGVDGRFTMAWVAVPSLAITMDEQRYMLLGVDDGDVCARFESVTGCSPLCCAVMRTASCSTIRASLVACADRAVSENRVRGPQPRQLPRTPSRSSPDQKSIRITASGGSAAELDQAGCRERRERAGVHLLSDRLGRHRRRRLERGGLRWRASSTALQPTGSLVAEATRPLV